MEKKPRLSRKEHGEYDDIRLFHFKNRIARYVV